MNCFVKLFARNTFSETSEFPVAFFSTDISDKIFQKPLSKHKI